MGETLDARDPGGGPADPRAPKPVTAHTRAALARFAATLPPDDPADHERARRGLIARRSDPVIPRPDGSPAWDSSRWAFAVGPAPDTVNPSLWRQARLNAEHGLFEVVDGFYQVRGYDISNVTFVRGETGWIVIDPLTVPDTARAAYELVTEHLGRRPVTAVVYTHSHVDHFGGVLGVLSREQVAAGEVPIVAPEGFLEAVVGENVLVEAAMGRRATYMYGMLLPPGAHGHVDCGLGKALPFGSSAIVPPTVEITATGQELVLDGVRIVFQLTPDSEAPAEMHFFFPDHGVLCMAENCSGTMHNVLTLRGAVVRDARRWSRYIDEALRRFGDRADVVFTSHSWPHWGRDEVRAFLSQQRDLYRFVHDQSVRLMNLGCTPLEIAEQLELPPGLWADHRCHGYYGTLSHNSRAVYQRYLGWFDGNSASLDPLPPEAAGRRYVDAMGGADAVLATARESFDAGDYRWTAQLLNHLVFAQPDHVEARLLAADALEQLGYQAESGPWRDFYLTGAQELRHGEPRVVLMTRPRPDMASGMRLEQVLDHLAVRLDGPAAAALGTVEIGWRLDDTGEQMVTALSNGALHGASGVAASSPAATVHLSRAVLDDLVCRGGSLHERVDAGEVRIDGDADVVHRLWSLLVDFPRFFPIVTP